MIHCSTAGALHRAARLGQALLSLKQLNTHQQAIMPRPTCRGFFMTSVNTYQNTTPTTRFLRSRRPRVRTSRLLPRTAELPSYSITAASVTSSSGTLESRKFTPFWFQTCRTCSALCPEPQIQNDSSISSRCIPGLPPPILTVWFFRPQFSLHVHGRRLRLRTGCPHL